MHQCRERIGRRPERLEFDLEPTERTGRVVEFQGCLRRILRKARAHDVRQLGRFVPPQEPPQQDVRTPHVPRRLDHKRRVGQTREQPLQLEQPPRQGSVVGTGDEKRLDRRRRGDDRSVDEPRCHGDRAACVEHRHDPLTDVSDRSRIAGQAMIPPLVVLGADHGNGLAFHQRGPDSVRASRGLAPERTLYESGFHDRGLERLSDVPSDHEAVRVAEQTAEARPRDRRRERVELSTRREQRREPFLRPGKDFERHPGFARIVGGQAGVAATRPSLEYQAALDLARGALAALEPFPELQVGDRRTWNCSHAQDHIPHLLGASMGLSLADRRLVDVAGSAVRCSVSLQVQTVRFRQTIRFQSWPSICCSTRRTAVRSQGSPVRGSSGAAPESQCGGVSPSGSGPPSDSSCVPRPTDRGPWARIVREPDAPVRPRRRFRWNGLPERRTAGVLCDAMGPVARVTHPSSP